MSVYIIAEAPHLNCLPILIGTRQEGRFPAESAPVPQPGHGRDLWAGSGYPAPYTYAHPFGRRDVCQPR